eukprot:g207.t1
MATGYKSVRDARPQQSEHQHQSPEEPRDADKSRKPGLPCWAIALIIVGSVLFVGLIIGLVAHAIGKDADSENEEKQKSSADRFGDAFWNRIDADEDKSAADVPGAGFLHPAESARRAQQVFLRQDGGRHYRGGNFNLAWAIEPLCSGESREYRCVFGLRFNIGSGEHSARNYPLILDTSGGTKVWYREALAVGPFARKKRHTSTTEAPLSARYKVPGTSTEKKSENLARVTYPAHGTVEGPLVGDVVTVSGAEGEPVPGQLDVGGHARDTNLALIRVTTEWKKPGVLDMGRFTGILGLGPRIQLAGKAQFEETRENAKGLSPSVPASTFLEMLSVHLHRASKKGEAPADPVFSFDVTAENGSWLSRPHFVVGGTPRGLSLRRFPVAKELQYDTEDEKLTALLRDTITDRFRDALETDRVEDDLLDSLYLRGVLGQLIIPRLQTELDTLQAAEKDKPLSQQKFSNARLREALDFRGDKWTLHAKRIRIGQTVLNASENLFTAFPENEEPEEEDGARGGGDPAAARAPDVKSWHLETAWKGFVDWSYAYPEDMADEKKAFGGDVTRYSMSNGSAWQRPQKNKLIAIGKPDPVEKKDRRWRLKLDSGASMMVLSPPLWKIFERKRAGKSCLDGPEIGVELAMEGGGEKGDDVDGQAFWYFVTPKEYCYCGKNVASESACVSENTAGQATLLGLPFHKAFYIGYDWENQAVLLPDLSR